MKRNNLLIIAGGGTGGHVLAGVAVADEWKKNSANVLFVGAAGQIETKLVPHAGYRLTLLSLGSLNRVSIMRKLKTLFQLPLSFVKSFSILICEKPAAVLGVGGYASGPLVFSARMLGIPTAILEQNVVAGFTNRILGKMAHRIFCAFPGEYRDFDKAKILITGNPVRSQMKRLPSATRNPFSIFIFGGSQGAIAVNTLVIEAIPFLNDLPLSWIHQTGEKDYDRIRAAHTRLKSNARVDKFIYEMRECYAASSLVICRAGSSTLAEIAAVGRASILIPLPTAADNHQEMNARVFSEAGSAYLFKQNGSRGVDLAKLIREIYVKRDSLSVIESQVTRFYRPDSAKLIVSNMQTMAGIGPS